MNERPLAPTTFQLLRAASAVAERLDGVLAPIGLSLSKFRVLSLLAEAGEPLPLHALADHAACVRSNITQLVDRLEAEKLVRRVPDARDRRSVRAELTPEGRRRHAAGARAVQEAEKELRSLLPKEDREALARLAGILADKC